MLLTTAVTTESCTTVAFLYISVVRCVKKQPEGKKHACPATAGEKAARNMHVRDVSAVSFTSEINEFFCEGPRTTEATHGRGRNIVHWDIRETALSLHVALLWGEFPSKCTVLFPMWRVYAHFLFEVHVLPICSQQTRGSISIRPASSALLLCFGNRCLGTIWCSAVEENWVRTVPSVAKQLWSGVCFVPTVIFCHQRTRAEQARKN